ncbi:MAG TPA: efflux RND transporter periplasmic adaptor subunit [Chitinophagaceae bacterium]|nr:efflux RND transporter periplasmic adaptor subunit [Chitinophagaceae bacterium]
MMISSTLNFSLTPWAVCRVVFLILAVAALLPSTGCKNDEQVPAKAEVLYTCSMHPEIMESAPGNCPLCGMDLTAYGKSAEPGANDIQLSNQQIHLGNIHVDTVGAGVIGNETVLNATLVYDQQKLFAISSRVKGRVEKLYHKNVGEYIRKGQPLMEVYSEELNNAKQEFLLALERRRVLDTSLIDFTQVITSARSKLFLLGMNESQLDALASGNKAQLTTTVFSNETGFITEVSVQEGEYINEGGTIVQVADLSTLWAEAQIYASRFSEIGGSDDVTVQIPGLGKTINGKIQFVNPEISPDKRINLARVTIPNPDNKLKPGMLASVRIKSGRTNVLSLPINAVIRTNKGSSVWVQIDKNTFTNKVVTTGLESGDRVEIISGLDNGDAVVISGAYLINSEYLLKMGAAPMGADEMK